MEMWMYAAVLCFIVSYFVGGINPAYLLSKSKGFDIRSRGSGNAGASNATVTLGKSVGIFCALFDIFKAYIVVKVSTRIFVTMKIVGLLAGACCILGHIFPIMMHFRGGKGLASLGGVILAYDPRFFVVILSLEIVFVLITTYICTVATSASVVFTLVLLINEGWICALLFTPVVIAMWSKHIINFKRIKYGVEAKIQYLWKKELEEARIQANWDALTEGERLYVELPELN